MQLHLPPLCSLQTLIGIIILLYVYLTLQSSISLHDKIVTNQKAQSTTTDRLASPQFRQSFVRERSTIPTPSPPPPPPPSISDLVASSGNLSQDFEITWGDGRGQIMDNGMKLTLSLDNSSGSGFQSRNEYLFGKIDMQIKLIPGNSAGTVTTYYLSSEATNPGNHDEIDFEFLGNVTGEPYTLHTNVYCQSVGSREQQFYLWFDPTKDFHTYSILWNPRTIVFYVDGTPIREFKNMERFGIPYLNKQPMRIYSSLWNADDWATQGGKVKTDWKEAPFIASYQNFSANACVWYSGLSSCDVKSKSSHLDDNAWLTEELGSVSLKRLKWAQNKYRTYNYCDDTMRFNEGLPKECTKTVLPREYQENCFGFCFCSFPTPPPFLFFPSVVQKGKRHL